MMCFRNFVYFVLTFDQFRVFYSGWKKHVLRCCLVWDPFFSVSCRDYDHECVEA
jgi:hypothetical protein